MPSVSKKQQRLMLAAAHTKGGFGGVSQAVGKEFVQADIKSGLLKSKPKCKKCKSSNCKCK